MVKTEGEGTKEELISCTSVAALITFEEGGMTRDVANQLTPLVVE